MAKVLIGNFKGPKGGKGDKGDPGTAATIQVGTTQTVQPEENAEVMNTGTANAAVLNFKIPRGEDGMTDLTAEYKDASEYTCQPTVNAPVVVKELDGKTEQGENPSPDNPQAIKGVGGMGYFDGEWRQGLYLSTDGSFSNANYGICSQNYIPCKKNDVIKIEYGETVPYLIIIFYNSNKNYISSQVSTKNINKLQAVAPENATYFMIDVQYPNDSAITPSTAKYCTVTINGEYQTGVEVTGAQLFDASRIQTKSQGGATVTNNGDGSFTISGSGNLSENFYTGFRISHEDSLALIRQGVLNAKFETSTNPNITFEVNYGSGAAVVNNNGKNVSSVEITSEIIGNPNLFIVVYFSGSEGNAITPGTIKPMIYQSGDGTWQPYHHTALTIPLTSPLYEGDKICYVKPGDKYVNADGDTVTADGVLYGVYRENAVVVFDGSEDEVFSEASASPGKIAFRMNDKAGSFYGEEEYLKCDKLKTIAKNISVGDMPENSIKESDTVGDNIVFIYINEEVNTVQLFRTWLQSNPLTVLYKLATPYFEPFPDQASFYNLRTDDTLSYVYSSDPIEPVLTVEVAKNSTGGYLLESYAQAQKNALSEADNASRLASVEQQLLTLNTTVSTMGGGSE